MAEITLSRGVWVDLHVAGAFAAGVALRLQSKAEQPIYLAAASVAPSIDDFDQADGWTLERFQSVDAALTGGDKLWAICTAGDAQLFAQLLAGAFAPSGAGDLDALLTELSEVSQDTLVLRTDLAALRAALIGVDSLGAELPSDFNYRPRGYAYDANGNLQTEVVTKAPNTWTKTYVYTGTQLTSVSAWVKV